MNNGFFCLKINNFKRSFKIFGWGNFSFFFVGLFWGLFPWTFLHLGEVLRDFVEILILKFKFFIPNFPAPPSGLCAAKCSTGFPVSVLFMSKWGISEQKIGKFQNFPKFPTFRPLQRVIHQFNSVGPKRWGKDDRIPGQKAAKNDIKKFIFFCPFLFLDFFTWNGPWHRTLAAYKTRPHLHWRWSDQERGRNGRAFRDFISPWSFHGISFSFLVVFGSFFFAFLATVLNFNIFLQKNSDAFKMENICEFYGVFGTLTMFYNFRGGGFGWFSHWAYEFLLYNLSCSEIYVGFEWSYRFMKV